jgi:SAM-dependent methyltransferase
MYVGLDVISEMTAATFLDLGEKRLVVGSADQLPFPGDSFDAVVFSFNGLGYLETRKGVYEEVHRVLAPRGVFLFSLHNARFVSGPTRTNPRSLVAWLPHIPVATAIALSSGRMWRGSGVIAHRYGGRDTLTGLRSTCLSRGVLTKELTSHGFRVEAVLSAPLPGLPGPLSPWYYYAAAREGVAAISQQV